MWKRIVITFILSETHCKFHNYQFWVFPSLSLNITTKTELMWNIFANFTQFGNINYEIKNFNLKYRKRYDSYRMRTISWLISTFENIINIDIESWSWSWRSSVSRTITTIWFSIGSIWRRINRSTWSRIISFCLEFAS